MITQKNAATFVSDDGKLTFSCDADSGLGMIHDFLLMIKGHVVEKMMNAQQEEQAASDKIKSIDEIQAQQNLPVEDTAV